MISGKQDWCVVTQTCRKKVKLAATPLESFGSLRQNKCAVVSVVSVQAKPRQKGQHCRPHLGGEAGQTGQCSTTCTTVSVSEPHDVHNIILAKAVYLFIPKYFKINHRQQFSPHVTQCRKGFRIVLAARTPDHNAIGLCDRGLCPWPVAPFAVAVCAVAPHRHSFSPRCHCFYLQASPPNCRPIPSCRDPRYKP